MNSTVDTEYDINVTWTSNPARAMDGQYVNISNTSGFGHNYTNIVIIIPVNTTDSANYTCTASVTATATDYIISSMENSDSVDITVKGLLIRFPTNFVSLGERE